MFTSRDYQAYFDQLYAIEREMEREARVLLRVVRHPEARILLTKLLRDEERHQRIVCSMRDLAAKRRSRSV